MKKLLDERNTYKNEIAPLVEELKKKMLLHNIPFFFTAAICVNEEDVDYVTELDTAEAIGLKMPDHRLTDIVRASIDIIPKEKETEILFSDFLSSSSEDMNPKDIPEDDQN